MLKATDKKYLQKRISISKENIEKKLKTWESIGERWKKKTPVLESFLYGNRIIGHIESLEFCLKEINDILNIDMLK